MCSKQLLLTVLISVTLQSSFAQECNEEIPSNAIVINANENSGDGNKSFWVCQQKQLTMFGSNNIIYAENYAKIVAGGSNNTFYLKNGASVDLNGGSNNVVHKEEFATITSGSGSGNGTVFCENVIFDYSNAPLNGCCPEEDVDAAKTYSITQDVTIISGENVTSNDGNKVFWVCPQTKFTMNGGLNTVYVENGSTIISKSANNTIILKNYSEFISEGGSSNTIEKEPDALVDMIGPSSIVQQISSISFDYTNAPVGGCCAENLISQVNELNDLIDLLIYPNPSEGNFIIRVGTIKDSLDSINLIIYNHSGKEIFRKFFLKNEKESEIKLANIPVGVYFITLSSLNSSMSRKIVVY